MRDKLQFVEQSTNHPNGLTPSPLSLRRGGTSHLFLLIFKKYLKQETGEKKVTSVPLSSRIGA